MRKFIVSTAPAGKGKPAPRSIRKITLWANNYSDATDRARTRLKSSGKRVVEVVSARAAGEDTL